MADLDGALDAIEKALLKESEAGYDCQRVDVRPSGHEEDAGCRACGANEGKFGNAAVFKRIEPKKLTLYCVVMLCAKCFDKAKAHEKIVLKMLMVSGARV